MVRAGDLLHAGAMLVTPGPRYSHQVATSQSEVGAYVIKRHNFYGFGHAAVRRRGWNELQNRVRLKRPPGDQARVDVRPSTHSLKESLTQLLPRSDGWNGALLQKRILLYFQKRIYFQLLFNQQTGGAICQSGLAVKRCNLPARTGG